MSSNANKGRGAKPQPLFVEALDFIRARNGSPDPGLRPVFRGPPGPVSRQSVPLCLENQYAVLQ